MLKVKCKPIAKPRLTRSDAWRKRKCVLQYYAYKDMLLKECEQQNFVLGDAFYVKFTIGFPPSYPKKKRELLLGKPHTIKSDLDNLLKGLMDAIKVNDQSVYYVIAYKVWGNKDSLLVKNLKFGEVKDTLIEEV